MASSILGPLQIIFTPGTIYDLEIIFARSRPVHTTPPGTFGDAVGGWSSPAPHHPNFGAMWPLLSLLTAIRPLEGETIQDQQAKCDDISLEKNLFLQVFKSQKWLRPHVTPRQAVQSS